MDDYLQGEQEEHNLDALLSSVLLAPSEPDEVLASDASAGGGPLSEDEEWAAIERNAKETQSSGLRGVMNDVPLLTREEEEKLGKVLQDSRASLVRELAGFPAAAEQLLEEMTASLDGERPLTDVFYNAFGGKEPNAEGTGMVSIPARWREQSEALAEALTRWRTTLAAGKKSSGALARATRQVHERYLDCEPAYPTLRVTLSRLTGEDRERLARDSALEPAAAEAALRAASRAERRLSLARTRLIESNLRLVFFMGQKLIGRGVSTDDLFQDGLMGLMRAADKFDYRLGYKFSTYACNWIWQGLTRSIADNSRTVRVAAHMHDYIVKLNKTNRELTQRLGRAPSAAELGLATGQSEEKVRVALDSARAPLSLDAPIGGEDDLSLKNLVTDPDQASIEAVMEESELPGQVEAVLSVLPEREATILKLRHGIGVSEPMTLEQIGQLFGITRERTRQLEARAMARLKAEVA